MAMSATFGSLFLRLSYYGDLFTISLDKLVDTHSLIIRARNDGTSGEDWVVNIS